MPNKKKGEKKTQGGNEDVKKNKPKKIRMGGTMGLTIKPDKQNYYNVVTSLDKSACSPPCSAPANCVPCCKLPVQPPPQICYYTPPFCVKQPGRRCC